MGSVVLLIVLSILLGLLTVVAIVFSIISFANRGKHKFTWLAIFVSAFIALCVCIYLAVSTTVDRVAGFAKDLPVTYSNDNGEDKGYNFADSLHSKQIEYLKLIEPENFKGKVPAQFYNYLGYQDYYRIPLKYPFALHCENVITNGILFNEEAVVSFNANDNGEKDCHIHNIIKFIFDENILVAEIVSSPGTKENDGYLIYHFGTGDREEIKNLADVEARLKQLNFTRPLKLLTCKEHYDLFKPE
ncbi:MAG: hypothetical protein H0W61_05785 [Bacteroidetes bacterium]|nr:hypothetical protein [Bacteroidota bacterium]